MDDHQNMMTQQLLARERRWQRTTHAAKVAFRLSLVLLVITQFVFYLTASRLSPTMVKAVFYGFTASLACTFLAAAGSVVVLEWSKADLKRYREFTTQAVTKLNILAQQHPELVVLRDLTELLDNAKAASESRRAFWSGVLVNLFFTLLGFGLSYMSTKLGLLR